MSKRSREDFEPSLSREPVNSPSSPANSVSVRIVNPSLTQQSSKIQQLNIAESGETPEMRCSLPPHKQTLSFQTFEEYEIHYAKEHTHRCIDCRKNFPTAHFLNLHIEENHDSLVVVRRERGEKTYACFVIDCDRVCSTPQKRRMHLVDKHSFPKDYDFYIVNYGIDRRSSMLRSGRHRRGSSAAMIQAEKARRRAGTLDSDATKERENETGDMEVEIKEEQGQTSGNTIRENKALPKKLQNSDEVMEDLVGGMSALKFIPPSIRFGRGGGKGGFSRT